MKADRDDAAVSKALAAIAEDCRTDRNVMPGIVEPQRRRTAPSRRSATCSVRSSASTRTARSSKKGTVPVFHGLIGRRCQCPVGPLCRSTRSRRWFMSSASKASAAIALVGAIASGDISGGAPMSRAGRVEPLTETASARRPNSMSTTRRPSRSGRTRCGWSLWAPGMPSARPKQAAACWLVELGNGEKFLFDIGSGCHERLAAQKIPYDLIDKVFFGHLHVDHMGDLPTFWLGGTTMNRLTPLRDLGPERRHPRVRHQARDGPDEADVRLGHRDSGWGHRLPRRRARRAPSSPSTRSTRSSTKRRA